MGNWRAKGIVCLVVVLIATAGVFGAQDFGVPVSSAPLSNDTGLFDTGTLQTTSSADWQLENIGRQITDPARTPSPFQETHTCNTTTLPTVPAAISMTLCGFLCISFVRDRRAWLAMAAGMLWLGQTGIQAVPELTHRICSRITTSTSSPIGLDRPDNASILLDLSFPPKCRIGNDIQRVSSVAVAGNCENAGRQYTSARKHNISLRAFASQTNQTARYTACPVRASGHFIVFSPAFIFQNLSRGPPPIKMNKGSSKSGFAKRSLMFFRQGKNQ